MRFAPSRIFWIEKLISLIDFLQVFAIIWITSQPWPWPQIWIAWTKWTVAFNIDIFSLTKNGALMGQTSILLTSQWGQMNGYLLYAAVYSIVSILLFLSILITNRLPSIYGRRYDKQQPYILCALYFTCYFYYLPQLLSLFRLFYCEPSTNLLSADPSISCSDSVYAGTLFLSLLFSLPLTLYLPYSVFNIIKDISTYINPADHEKLIQIYELMYMLNLDEEWISHFVYVISSFTCNGAYYYLHMIILKVLLLICFISMRQNFLLQSLVMWFVIFIFSVYYGFLHFPYRHWSSNAINITFLSLNLIGISFGVGNAFGVENGIMVNSVESLWILAFYSFGVILIISVILYCLISQSTHELTVHPPCLETLLNIQRDEKYCTKVWKWICTLKQGYNTRFHFVMSNNVVADIDGLEESIRQLHKCWLQAKFFGSIFTYPIGDLLEDILSIHSIRSSKCLRKHRYWNKAYIACVNDNIFYKRHYKFILMSPLKRRILTKIFAIRMFQKCAQRRFALTNSVLHSTNKSTTRKKRLYSIVNTQGSPLKFSITTNKKKNSFHTNDGTDTTSHSNSDNDGGNRSDSETSIENDDTDISEVDNELKIHQTTEAVKNLEILTLSKLDYYDKQLRKIDKNKITNNNNNDGTADNNNPLLHDNINEEIRQLDELLTSWNNVITNYENEELAGFLTFSNIEVEDWYTYRAALSTHIERLYNQE